MPARALDGELHVHESLFRDADQRARLLHARKDSLDDRAALVHDDGRHDAALPQRIDNLRLRFARNLLVAREREVHVVFRHESAGEQRFRGFQHAAERALGIERAAAPQDPVLDDRLKRGFGPAFLVDGHDVVVRHEHGRLSRVLSLQGKEHAAFSDLLVGAAAVYVRIQCLQKRAELLKFRLIDPAFVVGRNRLAADHRRKIVDRLLFVHRRFRLLRRGRLFRPEPQRADQHHRKERNHQRRKRQPKERHMFSSSRAPSEGALFP